MKRSAVLLVFLAGILALTGCRLRESQERIRSLTEDECRALVDKVIPLCAATAPKKKGDADDSRDWLRGSEIPRTLRYLNPRRVYLSDSAATIELWRGGTGDDTIYVIRDDGGNWMVSVHEGDLLNKDRLIWPAEQK